jgi:hypothetical protein
MPTFSCTRPGCLHQSRTLRGLNVHLAAHRRQETPAAHTPSTLADRLFWLAVRQRAEAARRRRAGLDSDSDGWESDDEETYSEPKYTITAYPGAARPCNAAGEFVDPNTTAPVPPPPVDNTNSPYAPFESSSQIRWSDLITRFHLSEACTEDLLSILEEEVRLLEVVEAGGAVKEGRD